MTVKAQYVQREGSEVILPLSYDKLDDFKGKLKLGDYVELGFKRWSCSRTGRQNRYLHSLINRWKDEMGDSMTEAKNMFCIERGIAINVVNWEVFDPPDWGGHFVLYHLVLYFRKSTTEYSTVEMKALIDGIKVAMDDNGIDYSDIDPEE